MTDYEFPVNNPTYITIGDDEAGIATDMVCVPEYYKDDIESVMITHGTVADRTEKLAETIYNDYKDKDSLHLLCVLKGGSHFFTLLFRFLQRFFRYEGHLDLKADFIRVKSYENESSTGDVRISDLDISVLEGRNVLVVEDIVDTGHTMVALLQHLDAAKPASVAVASMLVKRTDKSVGYMPNYAGFSIPNKFVVGCYLDFNEEFRDLDHVCIISEAGFNKYRQ